MTDEKLSIIIPTQNRVSELKRLLGSIAVQEFQPVQIIIVDGGTVMAGDALKEFAALPIEYIRRIPPSLTAQRNRGIKSVCPQATLVAFLDDDIVLEKDSLKKMAEFWQGASADTAGAAFNLTNERYKRVSLLQKLFLANTEQANRVLPSGFQGKVCFQEQTRPAEWLVGCAMVWRRHIFQEFMFDEWFSGYARYEDVDFSYRVGRKYKLFIAAEAKVEHLNRVESTEFSFPLGKMQILNRLYFVKKNPGLSVPLCYWACFGLLLNNLIKGVRDKKYLHRARGNICGFADVLFLNQRQL